MTRVAFRAEHANRILYRVLSSFVGSDPCRGLTASPNATHKIRQSPSGLLCATGRRASIAEIQAQRGGGATAVEGNLREDVAFRDFFEELDQVTVEGATFLDGDS